MNTKIYVMTHKEFTKPEDDLYVSMHVGHALGNEFGYLADDTGDNISSKNKNYCELTGLYWMWKNATEDILGLCHYRRYFIKAEEFMKQSYIEDVLREYDIIVPNSGCTQYLTNKDHYANAHYLKDLEICKEVVLEKYPDYEEALALFMHTNLACWGNMMITTREILSKYCEWLFDILFEVERRVDISDYDDFQARIFGYLSERLLRVWLLKNEYHVREEEVRMIDPAEANNASKKVELVYRYTQIILRELTEKYRSGNEVDLVDISPLDVDFHGKIPVFVCWWQGLEQAPELVVKCLESIDRNMPEDLVEIHVITLENVGMYITLPDWIIQKYEAGKITLTHLSDILRFGLLYRYGGMWLDATYFMTGPLPRSIFEQNEFFTLRMRESKWKADIVKGKWAGNCIYLPAGHMFSRFVLNALYEYWHAQDMLIDYYLIDYIIAVAYNELPMIQAMIDACEYSNPHALSMLEELNHLYTKELYEMLTKDTALFKLSYKKDVQKENLLEQKTMWGYIASL